MDRFLISGTSAPILSAQDIDRMSEVAMSYHQMPQSSRRSWFFGMPVRITALGATACAVLLLAFIYTSGTSAPTVITQADDDYSEISEIAILDTLSDY